MFYEFIGLGYDVVFSLWVCFIWFSFGCLICL